MKMVALSPIMKEAFSKTKPYPVATASKDGIPNVVPMTQVWLFDDETVWIVDNFMLKTISNLKENPKASIYVYTSEPKACFQIKGNVMLYTAGEKFQKMKTIMQERNPKLPARTLVEMKITEVYECWYGPEAGKKLI
jgi:predicted pyridoxine 5'-phosphate oxidase superfamily flavin-nucleotide-binding protein